jgi:uncharacterized metal-binding protein
MADNCCSTGGIKLLYACSGAADVGELADRVVRKLWSEGFATKTCLAGVGADISGFVQSAKGADENITIDGCPQSCAKKCLERIGMKPTSIMLADLGYKKGESPVTDEAIEKIAGLVKFVPPTGTSAGGCGCSGNC